MAIGGGGNGWSEGKSIAVDKNGDIILSGWYRMNLYFNNDYVSNGGNTNGPDDTFIAKFDGQGILKWLKKVSCNLYSSSNDLAINKDNDIILTGYFRGLIQIDDNIFRSTVSNYYDIYVLELNEDSKFSWFKSFGGDDPMNDIGYGIVTYNDNIFVTGMYSQNSWFDDIFLSCNGASDIFVLKLSNNINQISTEEKDDGIFIYPNPCSNKLIISFKDHTSLSYQIQLSNTTGRVVFVDDFLDWELSQIVIDMSSFANGVYFLNIHDLKGKKSITKKIIKSS